MVQLAVGHIERFNPAFMALLSRGLRRRPDLMDIRRYSPLPARITDASCVTDMMIHDIDLALKLASSGVKYISATGRSIKTNRLDVCHAVLVFENGAVANIEANRVHTEKVRMLYGAYSGSIYEIDMLNRSALLRSKDGISQLPVAQHDQLQFELREFVSAVLEGKKPTVTGEDGVAALEIANAVEEAALRK